MKRYVTLQIYFLSITWIHTVSILQWFCFKKTRPQGPPRTDGLPDTSAAEQFVAVAGPINVIYLRFGKNPADLEAMS